MSRTIRTLIALLVVSFALGASACADATGPQQHGCDWSGGKTGTSFTRSNGGGLARVEVR